MSPKSVEVAPFRLYLSTETESVKTSVEGGRKTSKPKASQTEGGRESEETKKRTNQPTNVVRSRRQFSLSYLYSLRYFEWWPCVGRLVAWLPPVLWRNIGSNDASSRGKKNICCPDNCSYALWRWNFLGKHSKFSISTEWNEKVKIYFTIENVYKKQKTIRLGRGEKSVGWWRRGTFSANTYTCTHVALVDLHSLL